MIVPETYWIIHGVVRASAPVPASAPEHMRVTFDDLSAILSPFTASDVSSSPGQADLEEAALARGAEAALAHNALLTAYAVATDVVPIRYGAAASSPATAVSLLSRDAVRYRAILDRVSGASEYALRLSPRPPEAEAEAAPVVGGRAYLVAQRHRRDSRGQLADARLGVAEDLRRDLTSIARELAPMPKRADRLLDVAILVPRGAVDALVRIARTAYDRAAACGLDLALIGPWPTYSFAQTGDADPRPRLAK